MWERLRPFSLLDRSARSLFLRAFVLLPLVTLSLRWKGFRATHSMLEKFLPSPGQESDDHSVPTVAALTARMLYSADRHGLHPSSCLAKSLALWWLLGRQGIASDLRIGVRKENGNFEAHAWVEREGVALNEPEEHHRHYAVFDAALASLPRGPK